MLFKEDGYNMAAKLIVEEGDLKGLSLSLEEGQVWTIGRDPDECQLVIEDPLVSRKHLVARRTEEGYIIENLSRTNPALLNDEEIDEQGHLLQNGDTIKIGNEVLRFYEDSSAHVLDAAALSAEDEESQEIEDASIDEMEAPAAKEKIETRQEEKDIKTPSSPKKEIEVPPEPKEEVKKEIEVPPLKEEIETPLAPKEEIEVPPEPKEEAKGEIEEVPPAPKEEAKKEVETPPALTEETETSPAPKEEIEVPSAPEEEPAEEIEKVPLEPAEEPKKEIDEVPPEPEEMKEEIKEIPPGPEEEPAEEIEEVLPEPEEVKEEAHEEVESPASEEPEEQIEPFSAPDEETETPDELHQEEEIISPSVPENEIADFPADEINDPHTNERDIPMPHEENLPKPEAAPTRPLPHPYSPPPSPGYDLSAQQDTVFGDENDQLEGSLAEIDFGVIETGRWLLKVISGPNNGAEFYMQAGNSYVIGTDPQGCDIVFHDTSVSRQHARITVSSEDAIFIEDLKSRNGVLINGNPIEDKQELSPNIIVTLGTTSFIVYDREGEMQTIISPLLPSIMKALKQEPEKSEEDKEGALQEVPEDAEKAAAQIPPPVIEAPPAPKPRALGSYIVLSTILGFFVLAGIGTFTLFREEPVVTETYENADALIKQTLQPFPSIRWTFNKSNGGLLLLGHVTNIDEKNQLIYKLGTLKFIKNIDDNGIIIDEGVWNEINSLLASNPAWKGITVHSSTPGQFILSGELKTRKQSEQLSSYLSLNFPYLDLLKKEIVVEEDVINQIQSWLNDQQLMQVTPSMANDEIILNGTVPPDKANDLQSIIAKIKQIPGVRMVTSLVRSQAAETTMLNITNQYPVTGHSRVGNKYTVVINGHILSEESELEGMTITKITSNRVYLEKDGEKFRIDY